MATASSQARQDLLRSFWLMAFDEPVGLLLATSDPQGLRAALYTARAKMSLPQLADMQIRISPWPEGQLVICHPPGVSSHAP